MAFEIADVIRVDTEIQPATIPAVFGRTLIFSRADQIFGSDSNDRVRVFITADEANASIPAGITNLRAAVTRYFSQSPYPPPLVVGRQFITSVAAGIEGNTITLTDLNGQTLEFELNRETISVTFGATPTVTSAATAIETAINAGTFSGISVSAVTSGTARDGVTPSVTNPAFDVTGFGNVSLSLGGSQADEIFGIGPVVTSGFVLDPSVADALSNIRANNNSWYFITTDDSFADAQKNEIANWAAASRNKTAVIDIVSNDPNVFDDISSDAYDISQKNSDRVAIIWSRNEDYKAASLAARFSSIDLGGAGILRTAKFIGFPGAEPDGITSTQKAILDTARVNYYTEFGTAAILAEGVNTAESGWIDVRFWLDWFAQAVQTAVFDLYRGSTSVPQTEEGLQIQRTVMEDVCEQGVVNGGIGPGNVSEPTAGDVRRFTGASFSGYLASGYLVGIRSINSQTLARRATRVAPGSRVYLKGTGALHEADIIVDFTQ